MPARSTTEGSSSGTRRRPSCPADRRLPTSDHRRAARRASAQQGPGRAAAGRAAPAPPTDAPSRRRPRAVGLEQQHLGAAPVALCSASRAASTRVSLTTTTSPGPSSSGRSATVAVLGAGARPAPGPTSSRAALAGLHRRLGDGRLGQPVGVGVHGSAGRGRRHGSRDGGVGRHRPMVADVDRRAGPPGQRSRAGQSSVASTGVSPRWAQARGAAIRPRVVRRSRPCWRRYGS